MTTNTRPDRSPPTSQPPTSRLCAPPLAHHAPCEPRSLCYPPAQSPTCALTADARAMASHSLCYPSQPKPHLPTHRRRPRHGLAIPMPRRSLLAPAGTHRRRPRHGLALPMLPHPASAPPAHTPQTPAPWPRTPYATPPSLSPTCAHTAVARLLASHSQRRAEAIQPPPSNGPPSAVSQKSPYAAKQPRAQRYLTARGLRPATPNDALV